MWVALEVTPWRSGAGVARRAAELAAAAGQAGLGRAPAGRFGPRAVRPGQPGGRRQNRERWVRFVDSDLGRALRQYDAAATVAQRQEALDRVYGALGALNADERERIRGSPR